MERLREAVRTRMASDRELWEQMEQEGALPVLARMLRRYDAETAAGIETPAIAPLPPALVDELREPAPASAAGGDGVVISHELARYLARTLDAAARFAEQMPLYVHRADVGTWAADVKVSSTEAAMKLRRAVLAGELPNEAVALDAAPVRAGSAA